MSCRHSRSRGLVSRLLLSCAALLTAWGRENRDSWTPKPFWGEAQLRSGAVVHTPQQFAAVIRKLDSGQPINVVAWGSSVTSEYGGCGTDSSRNFLLTPGIPRRCDPWLHTDTATDERDGFATGWGTLFMRLLNDTWPHQDHKFANNGVAGCMLFCYLDSTCEQSVLPNPLDLIIMENMHTWTMPEHIEAAIRNVIHDASRMSPNASRPAVILYNSYAVVETVETVEWTECIAHLRCNTSCLPEANGFKHSVGKALPQTHEPQTLELGALYGIDVLSSNTFLHMLMRDGLMPREGVAACEALSKLFMDTIHPRMLGRYMMGELLFASLQRARDWLRAHPDAVAPGLPMRPYANGSLLLEQKRCYMSTVHGPEFQHHMHAHNVPKSYLDVVSSHGWQLVFYDNNQTHRHKPGLVAWHPDSVLQFRINTDMRQPGFDPGGVAVVITYLISYTERGQAEVSCVSDCTCDPMVMDSHTADRHSIAKTSAMMVSQSPTCVLQVKVLPTTSSGGHRFKILAVTVKGPLPQSTPT